MSNSSLDANNVLTKILDNVPHCIFWKDRDLVFKGCNRMFAQQFGFKEPKDIIGKTDYDFPWSDELREKYKKDDLEIIQTKTPKLGYEEQQTQPDGTINTVLVSKVPLYDENINVVGILGVYSDITERKHLEESLIKERIAKEKAEETSQAKAEFLANIRHDLRTPLTGIIGSANLIREEIKESRITEYIDNIQASSYALLEFLNEILEVLRITSNEIPLLRKKFDLKEKLESVIKLNLAKAGEKQLSLNLNYDNAIPKYLIGDPKRIQRIVLELVTNALNFTDHGKVEVCILLAKTVEKDIVIKIMVTDTGIGIPKDKTEEIFERFKRLTPSYQGLHKGAGLGLSIVKQFIDDLEGEIYLESSLGKGSTFTCIIPLQKALLDESFGIDQSSTEWQKSPLIKSVTDTSFSEDKNYSEASTRILIVEDSEIAAKVAQATLKSLDCVSDLATHGQSAVKLAKNGNYDLIFMDVGLPDISGNDATKQIREWESLYEKHTPIIALTAHIDIENKQECIEAGMDAVLSKPLLKETALDILNAFIPRRADQQKLSTQPKKQKEEKIRELFQLPAAVIDLELGAKLSFDKSEEAAREMITLLVEFLPEILTKLQTAHNQQDWNDIEKTVHQLHGGVCYCGAPRLKSACSNLETYLKSGEVELRDPLYNQLLQEIEAVRNACTS